ncbi:MAG: DUF3467 domain-containing protein [Anaerolineaceae bacterium]|nr:DUF3467 domain-containing protein [Anaerolineaceae bacterium]
MSESNKKKIPPRRMIKMEISEDQENIYSNMVRLSHSPSEIVFDFSAFLPGLSTAKIKARIIMSPTGAKMFLRSLEENLKRYETAFGEIPVHGDTSLARDLFRTIQPPDLSKEEPE